jgi:hypothetical protein
MTLELSKLIPTGRVKNVAKHVAANSRDLGTVGGIPRTVCKLCVLLEGLLELERGPVKCVNLHVLRRCDDLEGTRLLEVARQDLLSVATDLTHRAACVPHKHPTKRVTPIPDLQTASQSSV